ncbi:hypothetical protein C8J57DRAFT_1251254 [Mycena rebaudengoi]|nr:hypothetical protein C8J57DRAFT_1251254 [Mycena rebaudengoi]
MHEVVEVLPYKTPVDDTVQIIHLQDRKSEPSTNPKIRTVNSSVYSPYGRIGTSPSSYYWCSAHKLLEGGGSNPPVGLAVTEYRVISFLLLLLSSSFAPSAGIDAEQSIRTWGTLPRTLARSAKSSVDLQLSGRVGKLDSPLDMPVLSRMRRISTARITSDALAVTKVAVNAIQASTDAVPHLKSAVSAVIEGIQAKSKHIAERSARLVQDIWGQTKDFGVALPLEMERSVVEIKTGPGKLPTG